MNPNQQIQNPITINNILFGGISDSKYIGVANSVPRLVGFDLHSEPGLLKVNQKMTKLSSSTITELCKVAVNCSNGNKYWMSSESGKIWQQDSSNAFALVYTVSPTAGQAKILGAAEYNEYIYFFTQNYVHRISVSAANVNAAGGASAWSANVQANWQCLNLIQTIGGIGATAYTLQTSVNEGATHKQTFVGEDNELESIEVKILAKGTGNWTVTVHDSSNNVIGSKTIANGSLSTGLVRFQFDVPLKLIPSGTYHTHVTSTVGDGTIDTSVNNDAESAQMSFYAVSDTNVHPTRDVNLVLYIGDRRYVHQIDDDVFTRKAVDIFAPHTITALGKSGTDLLIGTTIANVNKCSLFWWNTWSVSFSHEDPIEESGVNAILEADNFILLQAGNAGSFYTVGEGIVEKYKRVPGDYSPTKKMTIGAHSCTIFDGRPVFGVSNVSGNPCDQGIYTFGSYGQGYNLVLSLDYPISQVDGSGYNILSNVEIGAVIVSGLNVYMSWKDSTGTPVCGVDGIDWSNKLAKPFLESRVIKISNDSATFRLVEVTYESLPSGTSIVVKTSKNHEAFGSPQTTMTDIDRNKVYVESLGDEARVYRVRIEGVSSSNDAPKIEDINIYWE